MLEELHWLPVRYRIMYKILLLVFKSLNGEAPESYQPAPLQNTVTYVEVIIAATLGNPDSSLENIWGPCFFRGGPEIVEHSSIRIKIE